MRSSRTFDPLRTFAFAKALIASNAAERRRLGFAVKHRGSRCGKEEENHRSSKPKPARARISQTDVPAHSLEDALRIPRAIHENYGGHGTKPFDVAAAMDLKPGSSQFKMLSGAAIAYGLTEGGYNAAEITITELGRKILRPLEDGADLAGKREAVLKPKMVGDFLRKYNGSPLPKENIAHNVLIDMGVPANRADSVFGLIIESANSLGFLRDIKGTRYVNLSPPDGFVADTSAESDDSSTEDDKNEAESGTTDPSPPQPPVVRQTQADATLNRRVFITHGRNQSFIDPIKKLLKFGELEAVVSVEKQSVSKPVPEKVMTDMRSCGAAIIHVEDELRLMDKDAKEHVILNPNVLIEIGAAMGLYGRRFILLVKEGVKLPSNLQGLYEVRYQGDTLDGQATIQLLEAINAMKTEGET